jgi:ATP-dependent Lon protease
MISTIPKAKLDYVIEFPELMESEEDMMFEEECEKIEVPAPTKQPFKRCVRVFDPANIALIKSKISAAAREDRVRKEVTILSAMKFDGWRSVPSFRNVQRVFSEFSVRFGNFSEVMEYLSGEMVLAGASRPDAFRIPPILLDGPPGVGKTAFAQALAESLGLPHCKLTAGGMQHAAVLTGTSSHWANSQPGEVFNMIARSESASGVLLIDEADKLSTNTEYSLLPALLDLLEPESARRFREESLGLQFDASRLIVLMTSNDSACMDSALLSRCRVFSIEAPELEQKRLIVMHEHEKLNKSMPSRRRLLLDSDAVEALVSRPIDVRLLIQSLRNGYIKALRTGEKLVLPELPDGVRERPKMGF